jgi:DNA repair exonuclease SbcCD nuclease subunit
MIAIINDTHFGARNDSPIFLEHFMEFWEQTFFPTLEERGIKRIIHLGDFMDRRKYVNFHTLHQVRTRFLEPLKKMNIEMDVTLGNHDVFFKNTNRLNSVVELFSSYPNIRIHESPEVLDLDGIKVGLVPWITKENAQQCLDFIRSAPVRVLMGHFEINGYEVLRGVEYKEGMEPSLLRSYEAVYSGHFHCRHSKENIHYLGTQYQMTFTDLDERKGFHILHTDTGEMEFVKNPHQIFHEIVYDDANHDYNILNCKPYRNTFVRIQIKNKMKPIMFDNLLDRLNDAPVHSITLVDQSEKDVNKDQQVVDVSKDTLTLICEEIDTMEGVGDPVRLKTLVREIYTESLQG